MHPAETYRRRAERAERDFENARDPKAKRFAQVAAQRWRELAELAQHQETDGPPIPHRFRDASEAMHYAQATGSRSTGRAPRLCEAAARTGRALRGAARVHSQGSDLRSLVPLDEQEKASEKEPS